METVTFELKATGDAGTGTFEGVMSAPVVDRDNEIVDFRAFDPLPDHITIDIDHGLTVEKTVGSGTPFYDDTDGLLKVKGTFASTPLGQMTRTLVKEGHIRHMSVAFRGAVRETDEKGVTHIVKGDLINCTITGIPANTATSLVAKVGARNSAKDQARIQDTHDHMVELGATCEAKHVSAAEPKSTDTEPPATGPAAQAAPDAGALVEVARARTRARLLLAQADFALE